MAKIGDDEIRIQCSLNTPREHLDISPGLFGSSQSELAQSLSLISISVQSRSDGSSWLATCARGLSIDRLHNRCRRAGWDGMSCDCDVSPSIVLLRSIVVWRGWSLGASSGTSALLCCESRTLRNLYVFDVASTSDSFRQNGHCCDQRRRGLMAESQIQSHLRELKDFCSICTKYQIPNISIK